MSDKDTVEPWWDLLEEQKPYGFSFLILACVLIELVVYLNFWSALVLTPFLYLVIVFAGLWNGRKSLWLAVFSGCLIISITYLHVGMLTPDSLLNAGMLCIVAFFTGTIVEQKRRYRQENLLTREKFKKLDEDKLACQEELKASQIAGDTLGRKLKLLSGLTHNDIFNNLSALIGSTDMLKTKITDTELLAEIDRSENIAYIIQRQIEFARIYERIGTSAPQWLNVDTQIHALLSSLPQKEITFSISLEGLEIFVDPLFEKVLANLINNSLMHGVRVSHISVSHLPFNQDIAIVYEDDGIGIHAVDKVQIFDKGVGKNPGFGLFLSKEILSVTGLSIKECGVYGNGARFEIFIPEGKFRFV
jgi:signal transduction histidine kinase